jgi:apolipoprotein D and lipocalin family protein
MMLVRHSSAFFCLFLPLGFIAVAQGQDLPVMPVSFVDLSRYVGRWYEITKIPNSFQKQCASRTTAEYTLRPDGKIKVFNRCIDAKDKEDSATGTAKIVDTKTNAKLKVSFVRFLGKNWFWGDYWIIGLDDDYQWAVVGTPSRKYGWILCREKSMGDEERAKCFAILRQQGYDPEDFVDSPQE